MSLRSSTENSDYAPALIAIVYAIVSVVWILVSDRAAALIARDSVMLTTLSILKGWVFVAVTAALLYVLVKTLYANRQAAYRKESAAHLETARARDLLASVVNSSGDMIFAMDMNGRYLLVNEAFSRSLGRPAAAIIGADDNALFTPEIAAELAATGQRVIASGKAEVREAPFETKDGARIFETTRAPLLDGDGHVFGLLGVARDVTEQRRTMRALDESESRFQQITEASADWIWEVNEQNRFVYASEGVKAILGYTPEEILGKSPFDFMPPEEAARVAKEFAQIAEQRLPFRDLDNINIHKNGELRQICTNGIPILGPDGSLKGYRGLDRDVTERKQADHSLTQAKELLHSVLNTIPDLIWLKDMEGRYLACNKRFESFFGAEESAILGKTDYDFVPQELAEFFRNRDRAALEAGHPIENEEEIVFSSDGHRETLQVIKTPYFNRQGQAAGVLGIGRDVTSRKAAETELRKRNEELERFNHITIGRELDMLEMKKTINQLSRELGRESPYPLSFLSNERNGRQA